MSCRCKDIIRILEELAPGYLAEEWDNVGLLTGDPECNINKVIMTLDVTLDVVHEAIRENAQMIVSHHPILFHSIKKIDYSQPEMQVVRELIKNDICLYAMHTNLDAVKGGVNDCLAQTLGLRDISVLQKTSGEKYLKLIVYVPVDHVQPILDVLFDHGAGQTGAYSRCSYISEGTGTFFAEEGTHPYIGEVGEFNKTKEARIETIIPAAKAAAAVAAMKEKHPYEEPAYDLFPVESPSLQAGMGRIGNLESGLTFKDFCGMVKTKLQASHVLSSAKENVLVKRIAVCGGSGSDCIESAACKGADVLVTGDMKHHNWLYARDRGILVVDAGHYYTERVVIHPLIEHLHWAVNALKYNIEIVESQIDTGSVHIY